MVEHIPVFFEGQDDLIDILATSMCSICYNTKSFIDFYILDCGIHEFNKRQLETLKEKFNNFSIKYIPIDLKQFDGLKGWGAGNFLDCYSRLLIPELAPELDRAIYLDTDTIALRDIKLLWDEDLGEYEIGAACDIGCNDFFQSLLVNNFNVNKDQIYLNAGVLLMNCKKIRENKSSEKWLKIARDYKDKINIINEEILGKYYENNNYKLLNSRYNLQDRKNEMVAVNPRFDSNYYQNEWKNVVIEHLSPGKAWRVALNDYNDNYLKHFESFWFFAKMTPFYDGMKLKFLDGIITKHKISFAYCLKLFNKIPLFTIRFKNNRYTFRLFNLISLFSFEKKKKGN